MQTIALNQQLADQTQHDRAQRAARAADRLRADPNPMRTVRHSFWRNRVVITVAIGPATH